MRPTLYLIDGHAQIFRAYYAPFGELTSPSGEPTKAVHVFCAMLLQMLRTRRPDYLAMVMDVADETTFRREIDPEYKANRDEAPEDLGPQIDRIVTILEAMGIPILRQAGLEADDLLATLARRLADRFDIHLVSSDKDLEQLLDEHVRLYDPRKDVVIGPKELEAKKGYGPHQAIEIQTLVGDTTDNVPGVRGIGPKTAVKLIHKYGSAEAVLQHAGELTPKMAENVRSFAAQLPKTRTLVTLRTDANIEFDVEAARCNRFALGRAIPVFEELGFNRLTSQLREFAGDANAEDPSDSVSASPSDDAPASGPSGAPMGSADDGAYMLVDDEAKFETFLKQLRKQPAFAFDTETTDIHPIQGELVGLSFSWSAGTGYYLPVRSALGKRLDQATALSSLRPILEDAAIQKCGQNLKYDLIVLRNAGIRVEGVDFDSMVASFVLDATRRSHGLDHLAREFLQYEMIPISDLIGSGKNQMTIDQADPKLVATYAAEDADIAWRLREILAPRIRDSAFESLFRETEVPLIETLAEMEFHGVALDASVLREMSSELGRRLTELTAEIHQAAGHAFNIDSPKQLATVLFDELGLRVVRRTKTARSTDAETLAVLATESAHALPGLVLEYRELAKLKSTYVDALPDFVSSKTGRIHASFHQTGAVTGRLSSSRPNLQNIPIRTEIGRQIRRAFVAGDADHVLVTADYSQIELRILAHFCREPSLLEAFHEDRDIHAAVAAQVFAVPLAEVTSEQRSRAKAVNFGIIYGQGPFGLARQTNMTQTEAKSFIESYYARYPKIQEFRQQCIEDAKRQGHVSTILGRRRSIPEIHSRNRQTASLGERLAVNTVVQGSAADLIKVAMIHLHRRIRAEQRPTRMLIQVHDELVFEVSRSSVEAECDMIRHEMTQAMDLVVPLKVDLAWGENWLEGK